MRQSNGPAPGIEKSRRGRRGVGGQSRHFPRPPASPPFISPPPPHVSPPFRSPPNSLPAIPLPSPPRLPLGLAPRYPADSIRLPSLLPSICRFRGFGSPSRARSGPFLFLFSLFFSLDWLANIWSVSMPRSRRDRRRGIAKRAVSSKVRVSGHSAPN